MSGPRSRLRSLQRSNLILPVSGLVGLVVFFSIAAPNFVTYQNFVNITREAAVLLIIGIGMTYVILQGSIDLSVGPIASLSGLMTALVLQSGAGTVTALMAGVAVGLLAGTVNGTLFAYAKIPSFLVTLGMSLVVSGIAQWIVGGTPIPIANPSFRSLATGTVLFNLPNVAVIALVLYGLGTVVNFRTKFGRYMFAIGGGEDVSRLSGVPVQRYKFLSLVVSGLAAGLGGLLLAARVGAATPTMGDPFMLASIAAVVMGGTALSGGVGGVHRTILGVAVITILRNGLDIMAVGPYLQLLSQGIVVIVAVAFTLDRRKIAVLK